MHTTHFSYCFTQMAREDSPLIEKKDSRQLWCPGERPEVQLSVDGQPLTTVSPRQDNVDIHYLLQAKSLRFADQGLVLYIAGVVLISPLFFLIPRRNLQPFQSAKQEWWGDTLIHFSTEMGNHVVKGNSQMNCFTSKLWRERTPPKELQQTARRS